MRTTRRAWLRSGVQAALAAAVARGLEAPLAAQTSEQASAEANRMTPAARRAVERGLKYLAERQNEDGSFGEGLYSRNVGVCSLAGMALMNAGHTPRRGVWGATTQRVVEFVASSCQESGFITQPGAVSHGPMYEHGFGTTFLSEVFGMTDAAQIREKLVRAVRLIVEKQNAEGGWRYYPERREADISVTICQVTALRAAKNAGLHVPPATIERAIEYVKRSQNADGGFMYMLQAGGPSRFPRSAAGVLALYNAGIYEGDELRRGLEYLIKFKPGGDKAQEAEGYYFYGHYYAAQAMWQAGGDYWRNWYPAVVNEILPQQRSDGSWQDTVSPIYGTAMACMVLQTPLGHLSVFQK